MNMCRRTTIKMKLSGQSKHIRLMATIVAVFEQRGGAPARPHCLLSSGFVGPFCPLRGGEPGQWADIARLGARRGAPCWRGAAADVQNRSGASKWRIQWSVCRWRATSTRAITNPLKTAKWGDGQLTAAGFQIIPRSSRMHPERGGWASDLELHLAFQENIHSLGLR